MSKTSATIKLIQILSSSNDYINTNDLGEIIETNSRNIKEYIKEIQACGYKVDSIAGVYGGYKISKGSTLPSLNLSSEELHSLKELTTYLKDCEYIEYNDLISAIGKIAASEMKDEIDPIIMVDKYPNQMDRGELKKRYNLINECILNQISIEIDYRNASNHLNKHIIKPYKMFLYNGNYFVLAQNNDTDEFLYYKLNRIENYFKTRNHFTLVKEFNLKDYLDEYGLVKNGEYYDIELIIKNCNTYIKEKIYGKNQKIEEIDSNTVRLNVSMQNKNMIKSFVLSFGKNCKVVSPSWLIDDLRSELWEVLGQYEQN